MKVYFDYQMLIEQRYGGVTRYFYKLITEFSNMRDIETEIHCFLNKNAYFAEYFGKRECTIPHSSAISKPINKLLSRNVWGINCDIIHPTFYDPYILDRKDAPIVVTVHDMIHELFPEIIGYNGILISDKARMIHEADHIIAISESTKNDILKVYPEIDEKKISVILHGMDILADNILERYKVQNNQYGRYILYVGAREGYKNFTTFYRAIEEVLKKDYELKLVCAGGGNFSTDELNLISEVRDQVIHVNVDDDELRMLYYHALCFVFPSMYEGFGIPTLEAFSCNCPAIISNTSSMPEVGGDAVEYIDPYNVDDIREKVRSVLYDEEKRLTLKRLGASRLLDFTWERTAKATFECYKDLLSVGKDQRV